MRTPGAERLLGYDVGQRDVLLGRAELQQVRRERRDIGGVGVAAAGLVGAERFLGGREGGGLVFQVELAEVVGKVEFARRAPRDADQGSAKLRECGYAEALFHHETLAVIVVHRGEGYALADIARERPSRGARQDIDLAGL